MGHTIWPHYRSMRNGFVNICKCYFASILKKFPKNYFLVVVCLLFNDISTFSGNLMPNPSF